MTSNNNTAWILGGAVLAYVLYKRYAPGLASAIAQPALPTGNYYIDPAGVAHTTGGVRPVPPAATQPAHLSPCTVPAYVDSRGHLWPADSHGIYNAQSGLCEPTNQHPAYITSPSNSNDSPLMFRLS